MLSKTGDIYYRLAAYFIILLSAERLDANMKKRLLSFILIFAMAIAILTPAQAKKAEAAESTNYSKWATPALVFGDTFGIYPLTWYEEDLTKSISKDQFRVLLYGLRRKIVESGFAQETGKAKPVIDDSITVKEALEAFYTMLSNFDYSKDLGFGSGLDAVSYMKEIGAYTGKNGEQNLKDLCSREQAMVIAAKIVIAFYDELGASSKGFLWQIKSNDNTVYLLGSVHLASTDIYPLSHNIWSAFFNSDALVVEANLFDQNDMIEMQKLMYYLDGTSLKDHISAETYQKIVKAAEQIGYSEDIVSLIKPWALYLILENYMISSTSTGEDSTAQLGIDYNLMANALLYKKPIYAVEGLKKQAEIFESFSDELIEYLLNAYCDQLLSGDVKAISSDYNEYLEALFKSWNEGDIETFKQLSVNDESDEFDGELTDDVKKYADEYNTKFYIQRDDGMAEYIDKLLKEEGHNTFFVVLGSSHYVSDYSVIDRLEKAGYTIEQIK